MRAAPAVVGVVEQVAAEGRERSTAITQISASSSYRMAVIRHRAASLTYRELGIACTKRGSSVSLPPLDHDLHHLLTVRRRPLRSAVSVSPCHPLAECPDEAGTLASYCGHRLVGADLVDEVLIALMAA